MDADDTLKEQLELDAILTVVDGRHCLQHIQGESSSSGRISEVSLLDSFAGPIPFYHFALPLIHNDLTLDVGSTGFKPFPLGKESYMGLCHEVLISSTQL